MQYADAARPPQDNLPSDLHVSSNLASRIDSCSPDPKVAEVSICVMRLCERAFLHAYNVPHTVLPVSIIYYGIHVCAPLLCCGVCAYYE